MGWEEGEKGKKVCDERRDDGAARVDRTTIKPVPWTMSLLRRAAPGVGGVLRGEIAPHRLVSTPSTRARMVWLGVRRELNIRPPPN
jgi:hypothetical protein